ncbi:hypothetical protein ACHAXT_010821 [Thalassiosira profunda]
MKAVASPLILLLLILLHAMSADARDLHVATRLHLGHAEHPPPPAKLRATLTSFARLAAAVGADRAVVAVDAEEKLEGYDLTGEVARICNSLNCDGDDSSEMDGDGAAATAASTNTGAEPLPPPPPPLHVLPIRPWGQFVPALNAIVAHCARNGARRVLLASAEVQLTQEAMDVLHSHLDMDTTLVVGAALPGHEYRAPENEAEVEVALTGRTVPWNTCAVWNVPKLALTGFPLVAEGLHPAEDGGEGASGVEEACTIAALQRILSPERARAKLVAVPGTAWEQDFEGDEKRREWHERKMRSKVTRAKRQLELMGLEGTVVHC